MPINRTVPSSVRLRSIKAKISVSSYSTLVSCTTVKKERKEDRRREKEKRESKKGLGDEEMR